MGLVVSFAGKSHTGKTTLITKLISELTARGFTVGAIKLTLAEVDLDTPGKDSWNFSQAGARTVCLASPSQLAILKRGNARPSVREVAEAYLADGDFVLIEGGKTEKGIPKIEVLASDRPRAPELPRHELVAVVSDFDISSGLPQFSHHEVEKLADFLEKLKHEAGT